MNDTLNFICTLDINGAHKNVSIIDGVAQCEQSGVELIPSEIPGVYHTNLNGSIVPVHVRTDGMTRVTISLRGYSYEATILRSKHQALFDIILASPAVKNRTVRVSTPMPGMLKHILVQDGAKVHKGDTLFTLEAMKMENAITTPIHGIVRHITAIEGQACEKGVQLCVIEPG